MKGFKGFIGRFKRGEGGFTLVELLVVIAILAILVAVVVPNFTGLIGKGELQTYNAEKKTIQTIMDAYMADNRVSALTVGYVRHNVIPSAEFCASPCTGIVSYFRQATKWCWAVATTGKVTNEQSAVNCTTTPPAIPSGGVA